MIELKALPMTTIDGEQTTFGALTDGKVTFVVNVASKCGLTPQYSKLEGLHEEFGGRGFTVLGFPTNQFGGQEPGSAEEIQEFCSATYGVTFPLSAKIDVNGSGRDPIYEHLTLLPDDSGEAGDVHWNFEKFLIAGDGQVVRRFRPRTQPDAPEIREAIGALLLGRLDGYSKVE